MLTGRVPGLLLGLFLGALLAAGCSSAPKRPAESFNLRNQGETQLDLANRAADQGNYPEAMTLLTEAWRLAVLSDDPALRIRTELSRGNVLFFLGMAEDADGAWRKALAEAERSGSPELAAICRIYLARGELLTLLAGENRAEGAPGSAAGIANGKNAGNIRSRVEAELGAVKSDSLALALGWTVIGLAEKKNRRWAEAENALKKALDIHEGERYLEQAAYDWYLIASVRSVAGRYDSALEALFNALSLDRRAENSRGLAADWRAAGEVYTKAGKTTEAEAAYSRSSEILDTLGGVRQTP